MSTDFPTHWNRQSRLRKSMGTLFPQERSDRCRVCKESVDDGRWNYCSERCRKIAKAVQKMFVWDVVREQILDRDDHTCQHCGLSKEMWWRAYWQVREIVDERTDHLKEVDMDEWRDKRRRLTARYDVESPTGGGFHVDHITPISEGGHPFDESNLQTLCKHCHEDKTAEENRAEEQRSNVTLADYLES